MKIEPGQIVVVNGQTLVARETFRGLGTMWVRYTISGRNQDENRYTTRDEWVQWSNN
jgi:hypothetical protein